MNLVLNVKVLFSTTMLHILSLSTAT